ncbi:MAG TPA: multicopper oxidase domain-containing protein, partial [Gemmatimonadaceae bacterium]|nr:multicopper oxidase domain-containing protein [Gemmatimonadaceae bacterium]
PAIPDRRSFLARASAIGAVSAAGALLSACRLEEQPASGGQQAPGTTPPVGLKAAAPYAARDASLPARAPGGHATVKFTAEEVNVYATQDLVVPAWTFNGTMPGPFIHVGVGDTVDFTLTNHGKIPHSMDFHAAQINPKEAFKSAMSGESHSFSFKPRRAGAFMYHCGTQPVLMHIGMGMVGAIIVDPPTPLPPAKEFVLVESELYLGKDDKGAPMFDYNKMLGTLPDYVVFNGIADQYLHNPITVKKGDRVRFYVVNAGPTQTCAFHIVGEQFDVVYLGEPPANAIRGVQTFAVPAGGGMIFELDCDVAGEFPFVNHQFGHGQKGAMGLLVVES